jgi:large subunit ribosomal protein L31e
MADKKQEPKTEKVEREYVINIRRQIEKVPIYRRTEKAARTIKEFLARHMKIRERDLKKVKIDRYLNEFLWARGIRNPKTRIKIRAVKEGDIVKAELAELPNELKFKKLREEKREQKGIEISKKKKEEKEAELKKEEQKEGKPEDEKKEETRREVESEKKAAVIEAGKEIEKAAGKRAKHEVKGKAKEPKRQFRQALQK